MIDEIEGIRKRYGVIRSGCIHLHHQEFSAKLFMDFILEQFANSRCNHFGSYWIVLK